MIIYPSGNGVLIEVDGIRIAVDTSRRFPKALHIVTHAHWDHLGAARSGPVFTNEETSELLRIRGLEGIGVRGVSKDGVEATFIPAGHIVGSSQVLLTNGKEVLVTGDFKLEDDIVVRGADVESVDVLIMDTTFGVPYFRFPSRKSLYRYLKRFVRESISNGESVVFFGYSVGKAQEVTGLLNSMGITPYVLPETNRVNVLYGLESKTVRSILPEPTVYILPPKFQKVLDAFSVQAGHQFRGLFVSGWNRELPLSSHADWYQTVRFVEKISPEVVITYGENASRSAYFLRREGFTAYPLVKGMFV